MLSLTPYITQMNSPKESYVYWTVHHLDSWIKRDQLDVTCFIISLFNAQHISDVNTSIIRSLRLICWVISWVVLLWYDVCWCYVVVCLGWCGIRMQCWSLYPDRWKGQCGKPGLSSFPDIAMSYRPLCQTRVGWSCFVYALHSITDWVHDRTNEISGRNQKEVNFWKQPF